MARAGSFIGSSESKNWRFVGLRESTIMNSLLLTNILPKIWVQKFALIIAFSITLTGDAITECFLSSYCCLCQQQTNKKLFKVLYLCLECFASAACLFSFWFVKWPNIFHISLFLGSQHMTQFEIERRCGGHSVIKQFKTILQILVAKPKLWEKKN